MDDQKPSNALQRLASAGRAHHQARSITLQKGMRQALGRVADALMELPMAVIGVKVQDVDETNLSEVFEENALLMLLDGPARARGAAMFDQVLVGGMIQQQTLGQVREDDGATRKMTRTDAAMCAPLVDGLIGAVAPNLDVHEERALIEGFRFGTRAEDPRSLMLALEATEYCVLRLTIDVAQGKRQGDMVLIFPRADANAPDTTDGAPDEDGAATTTPQLADTVMQVETVLKMILCDIPMSLDAVRGLKPGDVLSVPPGHFPNVRMTTITGRIVGRGAVGHVNGVRAVKPIRKPNYASHPMRRESDAKDLDLPEVELPDIREPVVEMPDAAPQLPAVMDAGPTETPDAGGGGDAGLPELDAAAPALDLPDLDATPDGPMDIDLPDLDDLPDLADLPDLDPVKVAS